MKFDNKGIFSLVIFALAVLAVGYFIFSSGLQKSGSKGPGAAAQISNDPSLACSKNSDCVLVQESCCPCTGLKAINKNYASEWVNKTSRLCGVVHPCTLQACRLPTSSGCLQGKCTPFLGNSVFEEEK